MAADLVPGQASLMGSAHVDPDLGARGVLESAGDGTPQAAATTCRSTRAAARTTGAAEHARWRAQRRAMRRSPSWPPHEVRSMRHKMALTGDIRAN
jgi:hypothetical protein